MKNNNTWTTKCGETIQIKDMTDNHLLNSVAFIWKQSDKFKLAAIEHFKSEAHIAGSFSFQGEIAQYYAEQDCMTLFDKAAELEDDHRHLVTEKFPLLLKELEKRNIKFPEHYLDYVLFEEY